jgi:hypothetical protein
MEMMRRSWRNDHENVSRVGGAMAVRIIKRMTEMSRNCDARMGAHWCPGGSLRLSRTANESREPEEKNHQVESGWETACDREIE